jgi:hypothetical protein
MAIIYSVTLSLQFPLFSLALAVWALLLTYMTNSFAQQQIGGSTLLPSNAAGPQIP